MADNQRIGWAMTVGGLSVSTAGYGYLTAYPQFAGYSWSFHPSPNNMNPSRETVGPRQTLAESLRRKNLCIDVRIDQLNVNNTGMTRGQASNAIGAAGELRDSRALQAKGYMVQSQVQTVV